MQDKVTVTYKDGRYEMTKSASGYGYNSASAIVDEIPAKPTKKINEGYYKNGTNFVSVGKKQVS